MDFIVFNACNDIPTQLIRPKDVTVVSNCVLNGLNLIYDYDGHRHKLANFSCIFNLATDTYEHH